MAKRPRNPIAEKLIAAVESGRTTWEKMCVATDLKYDTLKNIRTRDTISYITRKALKLSGVITEKDERDYEQWIQRHAPPKKLGRPSKYKGGRPPEKVAEENPNSLVKEE